MLGQLNNKGQTLIEMIVVISVGVLVVGGLVFATINSLRNANFAKNQAQVTKLAQEGIERVRSIRDQNGVAVFNHGGGQTSTFSQLYSVLMVSTCNPCKFNLNSAQNSLNSTSNPEIVGNFTRQVQITDDATNWASEKKITVVVSWTDPTGSHESKLTTILTKR